VKNIKIGIYKSIILPVVLYRCKTWFLTLWEEDRVFEDRVLRRIFGLKRKSVRGGWRNSIMRGFMIFTFFQI
jgi:hypothetical protein